MTDRSADILPVNQNLGGVTEQLTGIPLHFPARRRWLATMVFACALLLLLMVSIAALFTRGVGIWGINIPVNWAFAIHNYVWWLGIGHAGTLISAFLLLTGSEWRNTLNRFAETMTLFAVICAGIYPVLHLGRPWYLYWMFPYPATMGVWPQFRSPLEWDIWAVLTYLVPFLLAIRFIPMISIFETKELLHEEQEERHGG
jgi:molybdopterin-containing oxidoreductase family membrane subunit